MITEAEFLDRKWKKLDVNKWYKLGVMVKFASDTDRYTNTKIHVYHDFNHQGVTILGTPRYIGINTLEGIIKSGVKYVISICPVTPKQKRTLKNWIL